MRASDAHPRWAAAGLAMALVFAAACGHEREEPPRLVVLYAPCTVSRDFLAPYNPTVEYTPALGGLARGGLVFERHQTEAGQSGVAFASIFTGRQVLGHGVYAHPAALDDENLVIGEAFADRGFEVHSWLGHAMASAALNYAQGIPEANRHEAGLDATDSEFTGLLEKLRSEPDARAFVMTNFTVTHGPYRKDHVVEFCGKFPDECRTGGDPADLDRFAEIHRIHNLPLVWDFPGTVKSLGLAPAEVDSLIQVTEVLYKSNVWYLDKMLGGVIDAIIDAGVWEDTVLAFTADHGEVLYQENAFFHWTHGYQLAPEVLTVPFVLHGPTAGVPQGRYPNVTRSIDVLPSLASLVGAEVPGQEGRGVDLSAAIRGDEDPPELVAWSHTSLMTDLLWQHYRRYPMIATLFPDMAPSTMWVARREEDTLARIRRTPSNDWENVVVDLSEDPTGRENLYDPADPSHRAAIAGLWRYKSSLEAGAEASLATKAPLPLKRRRRLLEALGYIE